MYPLLLRRNARNRAVTEEDATGDDDEDDDGHVGGGPHVEDRPLVLQARMDSAGGLRCPA